MKEEVHVYEAEPAAARRRSPMKLTKEQALSYHRQMWSDMQRDLGDCPTRRQRFNYKDEWVYEHFPDESMLYSCFLCEYVDQHIKDFDKPCEECPIVWPNENEASDFFCCRGRENGLYYNMPISKLLALPERN